jgi:hypothetical protein
MNSAQKRDPDPDERLNEMLGSWKVDANLPPRFQEQVWRRIARSDSAGDAPFWVKAFRAMTEPFTRPKVAYAYIAVLLTFGIAAGSWTAQVKSSKMEAALGSRYVHTIDPYQFTGNE